MTLGFHIGAATNTGVERDVNQDSYAFAPGFAVVADGMGGHRGGEVASSLAVQEMLTRFVRPDMDTLVETVEHANRRILDAAAAKYGKTIEWMEVLAGEKAFNETGDWLPQDTIDKFEEYLIGIKGPLTTPIGGGFRSLNVAIRQIMDLYVCLRPVRWFEGVPSPVKEPQLVDMVIFRENTEDIYAGMEVESGTPEAKRMIELLHDAYGWEIREDSGIGIKPVSKFGSQRLQRAALDYAVRRNRGRVHLSLIHI